MLCSRLHCRPGGQAHTQLQLFLCSSGASLGVREPATQGQISIISVRLHTHPGRWNPGEEDEVLPVSWPGIHRLVLEYFDLQAALLLRFYDSLCLMTRTPLGSAWIPLVVRCVVTFLRFSLPHDQDSIGQCLNTSCCKLCCYVSTILSASWPGLHWAVPKYLLLYVVLLCFYDSLCLMTRTPLVGAWIPLVVSCVVVTSYDSHWVLWLVSCVVFMFLQLNP